MNTFIVTHIIDGDTFDVSPKWVWNGQTGTRVRPTGYDAPEIHEPGSASTTNRLRNLIHRRGVQLGTGYRIDRGRLVCDVYLNGRNLAESFPEYKT